MKNYKTSVNKPNRNVTIFKNVPEHKHYPIFIPFFRRQECYIFELQQQKWGLGLVP